MIHQSCQIKGNNANFGGGVSISGKEISYIGGQADISSNTATITSSSNLVETPTSLEVQIQTPYGLDVFLQNGELIPLNISAGFKLSDQEVYLRARLKTDSGSYYQLQPEDYCIIKPEE